MAKMYLVTLSLFVLALVMPVSSQLDDNNRDQLVVKDADRRDGFVPLNGPDFYIGRGRIKRGTNSGGQRSSGGRQSGHKLSKKHDAGAPVSRIPKLKRREVNQDAYGQDVYIRTGSATGFEPLGYGNILTMFDIAYLGDGRMKRGANTGGQGASGGYNEAGSSDARSGPDASNGHGGGHNTGEA